MKPKVLSILEQAQFLRADRVIYLISCSSKNESSDCPTSTGSCSSRSWLPETDVNGDGKKVSARLGWLCGVRSDCGLTLCASPGLESWSGSWCAEYVVCARDESGDLSR